MNLGEMKTLFTGLLKRRDCTNDLRDIFIQQGIARVQRELRLPPMEAAIEVVQDGSYIVFPIPSDLIELISLSIFDSAGNFVRTLEGVSTEEALTAARQPGLSEVYSRRGTDWIVGPVLEEGAKLRIDYYAELPSLAADEDTNTLTAVAPDVFIYAALSLAADYFIDKRVDRFEQRYQSIKQSLQDQADLDDLTAAKTVRPAYAWPD